MSEETKVEETKVDTTNPFNKGVTYDMFLSNVKGNTTVEKLLKKHNLSEAQTNWIKEELRKYKNNK